MRPETKANYPKDWAEISRRTIKERHYICEGCGQRGSRPRNILTVHHIDYNPANNVPGNFLVLCASCHLRLQHGIYPSLVAMSFGQLPFAPLR